MSEMEAALDQALGELATKLSDLKTSVETLIAGIPDGANLSDEISAVQSLLGDAQNITDTVQSATTSTEPPTEPGTEPPTEPTEPPTEPTEPGTESF